jgi:ASC-1-like (ASCH) protein
MEHELKIYPTYFEDVISGKKKFEIRKNDRKYRVGDTLILKEWDNIKYSGREARAEVIYLIDDKFVGIQPGYVVMGISLIR